eukprot:TRINITY_DN2270_c0_g1_i2.p2 TRINITY_DN2270_c0_g1~~TRINITY_DN2270_c0_g1_i2.p2  ORF type:complete len:225 (-),score=99.90 TRINITY_DN2270_c0_g1_i2:85-759(-)
MIRRPPRSTQSRSSAASDVYKRQIADKGDSIADTMWTSSSRMNPVDAARMRTSSIRIKEATATIRETPEDSKSKVENMAKLRTNILNYSFVFAIVLIIVGLVGAICNYAWLAMVMCVLAFVCMFVSWLCLGIHLGTAVVLDDTCYEIDLYVTDPNQRMFQPLQKILQCPDDDSFTQGYTSTSEIVQNMTIQLNNNVTGLTSLQMATLAPQGLSLIHISEPTRPY